MFGSSRSAGAAMIPETAPTADASPHPSASIQLTRMPSSRLASGWCAAARIASPIGVRCSSTYMRTRTIADTTITPRSW